MKEIIANGENIIIDWIKQKVKELIMISNDITEQIKELKKTIDAQFVKFDQLKESVIEKDGIYKTKIEHLEKDINDIRNDAKESLKEIWIGIDSIRTDIKDGNKARVVMIVTIGLAIISSLVSVIIALIKG